MVQDDGPVGLDRVTVAFDERLAGTLSGLTRAGVILLGDSVGPVASTLDSVTTAALTTAVSRAAIDSVPRELRTRDHRLLAVAARLDGAGTAVFARRLDEELAVLPELRRVIVAYGNQIAMEPTLEQSLSRIFAGRVAPSGVATTVAPGTAVDVVVVGGGGFTQAGTSTG